MFTVTIGSVQNHQLIATLPNVGCVRHLKVFIIFLRRIFKSKTYYIVKRKIKKKIFLFIFHSLIRELMAPPFCFKITIIEWIEA